MLTLSFMLIHSAAFADSSDNQNGSGLQIGSGYRSDSKAGREIENARGLFDRIMGKHSSSFVLEILNDKNVNLAPKAEAHSSQDRYEIEDGKEGKIIIRGNNANSMAVALNHYLRYYCKSSVSWYADDAISLPDALPPVGGRIESASTVDMRFFLNYCTFGYTMPWWQWRDWERFIDWMALNGVNLPLAITGQESVWYKVWSKLGLSDSEIRSFFTGPAHLPWHRMLNIDYWQGPLPHSWLEHQEELQKRIVKRERELGMKPVLPAFSGHVPYELKKIYPNAVISKLSSWGGFDSTYRSSFLDPMDPLFPEIQKAFLEEQTRLYGTDHIYGIDPFNEIEPPSWEPKYLARVSRKIYENLAAVDPQAIWLQMSWLYYYQRKDWTNERIEAFVTAVPQDKMILLDYFCERTEVWKMTDKFFGQPYIWNYLGNFGGNTMLAGNTKDVGLRIANTLANGGRNFRGLGSTLEGFDSNPHMYEYVFDKAWTSNISDEEWMNKWAERRLGNPAGGAGVKPGEAAASNAIASGYVKQAWQILNDSIYNNTSKTGHTNYVNARPNMTGKERYAKTGITYDNRTLLRTWRLLLKAADECAALAGKSAKTDSGNKNYNAISDTYKYDVVNIGRQVLGNHFDQLWADYLIAWKAKDVTGSRQISAKMMELLDDMDQLLSTHTSFMLGKWIADARALGSSPAEAGYYEINARNILTSWGDQGILLGDYANRSWAGLISSFYAKRWEMFFADAHTALVKNEPFDQEAYTRRVIEFEGRWWKAPEGTFPSKAQGNPIEIAKRLEAKYFGN